MHLNYKLLVATPEGRYYFRYPVEDRQFKMVRAGARKAVYYGKALYGRVTPAGRVDRTAPFSGQIAIGVIEDGKVEVLFTDIDPSQVMLNGRRNWPLINAAAEQKVRQYLCDSTTGSAHSAGDIGSCSTSSSSSSRTDAANASTVASTN